MVAAAPFLLALYWAALAGFLSCLMPVDVAQIVAMFVLVPTVIFGGTWIAD